MLCKHFSAICLLLKLQILLFFIFLSLPAEIAASLFPELLNICKLRYSPIRMSYPQEPQRSFTAYGNPFRMIIPKGSSRLSPKLLVLLDSFEAKLATRIEKLQPTNGKDILTLAWTRTAIESLCGIHTDVKDLIYALELPITTWDSKWIDIYLDNSMKLLDICIAFASEVSRIKQGQLFLNCALHNLSNGSSVRAHSSLDGWKQHMMGSKSSRFDKCFSAMDSLVQTLDLPKIKNSSEGKVLMRAIYGVKVVTLFICSVFAATFSGSTNLAPKMDIPDLSSYTWAKAFTNLHSFISNTHSNGGVIVFEEIEAINVVVEKMYSGSIEAKMSETSLHGSVEKLGNGMDAVAKEVDRFLHVVLTDRDALVCGLG